MKPVSAFFYNPEKPGKQLQLYPERNFFMHQSTKSLVWPVVALASSLLFSACSPRYIKAPPVSAEATQERLERGKYLAEHVAVCIDCHSTRNFQYFAGPLVSGTEGKGGELFDKKVGLPGKIYASNITPSAIGSWSDGEVFRAITCGVSKNDNPLFPIMPYPAYNRMSNNDVLSIIAYVRTLKPLEPAKYPARKLDFPINLLIGSMPKKYSEVIAPDTSDSLAYGKYLVTIASCADCHTPMKMGAPIKGMEFAGGTKFPMASGVTVSAPNITPDDETGIGRISRAEFIAWFKRYDHEIKIEDSDKGKNTIMPWVMYSGISESDLGKMYLYLRSVKQVLNNVEKYVSTKTSK